MTSNPNRRSLVTGASRGIGLALCRALVAGGEVIAVTRPSSDLEELKAVSGEADGRLHIHNLDITGPDNLAQLAGAVGDQFGQLDLLINNAGLMYDNESIETLTQSALHESFLLNAITPALVAQALLAPLRAADGSLIINISSSFASIELKNANMPARYSYSMSKAAANMLSKTMSFELADDGITVVAVHPGWVRTEIGGPDAQLSPEEAAANIVELVDKAEAESGSFVMAPERPIPW